MFNEYIENKIKGTWQEKHKKVIEDILIAINKKSNNYILKGGTALMECYNLTRFSEDIDLDSVDRNTIFDIIDTFANEKHFTYRISKKTDTVSRVMLHYGGKNEYGDKPLKIEVSHRMRKIEGYTKINNINVYNINMLSMFKTIAYVSRDRLRDLFDVTFIYNNFKESLKKESINEIYEVVFRKGIEQFDYLTRIEHDELIDIKELEEQFLIMCDSLGLLKKSDDQQNLLTPTM